MGSSMKYDPHIHGLMSSEKYPVVARTARFDAEINCALWKLRAERKAREIQKSRKR